MKYPKCIFSGIIAIALSGCGNSSNRLDHVTWLEIGGTLGGAMVGGYTGSQFGGGFGKLLYMTAGTLFGGSVGYSASRILELSDQSRYQSTVQRALSNSADGEIIRWNNPETGREGIFRAVNTYRNPKGQQCRKYRASVVFSDGVYSGGGVACEIGDGTWLKYFDEFS